MAWRATGLALICALAAACGGGPGQSGNGSLNMFEDPISNSESAGNGRLACSGGGTCSIAINTSQNGDSITFDFSLTIDPNSGACLLAPVPLDDSNPVQLVNGTVVYDGKQVGSYTTSGGRLTTLTDAQGDVLSCSSN